MVNPVVGGGKVEVLDPSAARVVRTTLTFKT